MKTPFKERRPPTDAEIRDYFELLKQDPRSRVFAPLAEALIRRGRLTEAEQICRMGMDANPQFSDGHLAFARVLFYLFRHEEALREVKLALALDARNAGAYVIAGEIFLAHSQVKAASEACLKALDIEPDNSEVPRLLERIRALKAPETTEPVPSAAPAESPSVERFKAAATTAPSRRRVGSTPIESDPLRQLLQDAKQHKEDERAGETAQATEEEPAFEVPTAPNRRPPRAPTPLPPLPSEPEPAAPAPMDDAIFAPADSDAPALPPHPPVPAQVPLGRIALSPPTPTGGSTSGVLGAVDAAQAIIDSYSDRAGDLGEDAIPLRVPRGAQFLSLLGLLLVLGAICGLVVWLAPWKPKAAVSRDGGSSATSAGQTQASVPAAIPIAAPQADDSAPATEPTAPDSPTDGGEAPTETNPANEAGPEDGSPAEPTASDTVAPAEEPPPATPVKPEPKTKKPPKKRTKPRRRRRQ